VVDSREVLVVDVTLLDVPHHQRRYVVGRVLVAHRERGERHVDLGLAQAQVVGHRPHRRGHVGGSRARGQEHLPDPQAQVHRQVDLACPLRLLLVVLLVHPAMVAPPRRARSQG
jgi:hypothetical protein